MQTASNINQGAIIKTLIQPNKYSKPSSHSKLNFSYNQKILSSPILCSEDSYRFLIQHWDKHLINLQEQVYVIFLNANDEVIAWRCFNTGTCNSTLFDIKLIMACALGCVAVKMIIAHNHPTGNLQPSNADIELTRRLVKACAILDIKLADHLIVSKQSYYSFYDKNLIA